jgi:hypothetical protein
MEAAAGQPGFWDDANMAQTAMRDLTKLRDEVMVWEGLHKRLTDAL